MKKFLSALMAVLSIPTMMAYDFETNGIFYNKLSDNTLEVTYQNLYETASYIGKVTIPEYVTYYGTEYKVTSIGRNAFKSTNVTDIVIPNTVVTIGEGSFMLSSLASLEIPNSVTTIEAFAFQWCYQLTSAVIGNSVEYMDSGVFYECTSLQTVTLGKALQFLNGNIFYGCVNIEKVEIPDLSAFLNIEFYDGGSNPLSFTQKCYINGEEVTDIQIPDTVEYIKGYAFYGCNWLKSVKISDSVVEIGESAFYQCTGLSTFETGKSLKSIEMLAFSGCTGLNNIKFESQLDYIGTAAFEECTGFTNLKIESVGSIYGYAFSDCTGLTELEIGNGVSEIGLMAFRNCSSLKTLIITDQDELMMDTYIFDNCNLETIYCSSPVPPSSLDYEVFDEDTYQNTIVYVPIEKLELYKVSMPWDAFKNLIGSDNLPGSGAVESIAFEKGSVNVYDLSGVLKIKNATKEMLENLSSGIYIINDKKVMIK